MVFDIKDKVVVITGGAGGIGFEIAGRFLEKYAKVVILVDLNGAQGSESVKTLNAKYGNNKAFFFECDITTDLEPTYKKIIQQFNDVDILINSAGIRNEFLLRKTIEINLTALIEWSFKFWEHMREDKGGKGGTIINVSSVYGYTVDQFIPIYKASKFGVMGFSKSLGHVYNYNRTGVRIIAICPGFTQTGLSNILNSVDELQEEYIEFKKTQPWQNVDSVGKAAIEIYETKESGTAWEIVGAKPIVSV